MNASITLAPLYGSLEGFGTAAVTCMLMPVAIILLLIFVWWGIVGLFIKERRGARLERVQTVSLPLTMPELIDLVHRKAVAGVLNGVVKDRILAGDPGVQRDLSRIVEHLLDSEDPTMDRQEREEAIKTIVERMMGSKPA